MKQSINENEATSVEATAVELSEDGLTVTLTVAAVAQVEVEQSVVYTVNEVAAEAFTVEADAALVEEVLVEKATAAVEQAEATLATEDITAAEEAIALVGTPKVNSTLTARVELVKTAVTNFLTAVKTKANDDNEIELFEALNATAAPFDVALLADAGVVKENSALYLTAIKGSDSAIAATATIEALKAVIKAANESASTGELSTLFADVDVAITAFDTATAALDKDVTPEELVIIEEAIADVQAAIDALPEAAVNPADEEVTKETLQEALDTAVEAFGEYVESVLPVVVADISTTQFDLFDTLNELGYEAVTSVNVPAYQTAILGSEQTKAELQEIIFTVNAQAFVAAIPTTPTQTAIDAAQVAVNKLAEDNAEKANLQTTIDAAQTALDANIVAAQDLALAVEKAEAALAAYDTTGLDVAETVYASLTDALAADPQDAAAITAAATAVEDAVAAYTTAVEAAEVALTAYEAAKGDVEETVYTEVTGALAAEPQVTATIVSTTAALVAATELLEAQATAAAAQAAYDATGLATTATEYTTLTDEITAPTDAATLTAAATAVETLVTAYNEAVEAANEALAAYDAAKGDVEAVVYTEVTGVLAAETQVTADIAGATAALVAATELLELNNAINAADVDALSAIVAAYGIVDAKGYYTLSKVQRPEFIEYLISANIDEDGVTTVIEVAAFKAQVADASTQVTAYLKLISDVNTATDVTVLITALQAANEDYAALTDAVVQLEVADAIYEVISDKEFAGYNTLADIAAAIVAATPAQ